MRSSWGYLSVDEVVEHAGKGQLALGGLEAARHRRSGPLLRGRLARKLREEIGVAPELLGRRERDRADAVLGGRQRGGREAGDPLRERADEVTQLVGVQRAVDPAVAFGQLRVVVLAAEHDLEGAPAAHEPREV